MIAEIKHRSPSAGTMLPAGRFPQRPGRPGSPEELWSAIRAVARAYRRAGAAAISVVTEPDFFGGDLAWLPEVKRISGLPVLMKDFVVDEVQLDLALSLGADAVLLIVAALDERHARAASPSRPGSEASPSSSRRTTRRKSGGRWPRARRSSG